MAETPDPGRTAQPAATETAIRVENVSKHYPLWTSPRARLNHSLLGGVRQLVPSGTGLAQRLDARRSAMVSSFHALEDVSLEIRKGESWGVIGVNGSGKSTLLKIISGNLRPTTGRVEVEGKVGRLDYSSGLNGNFTGRENIYMKAAIMGMTRDEIDRKIDSILQFADIGDFIDQPVKTYSSGMQARLGFGIIAHMETDILISDEALAVGDAFFVQKCMHYIRGFLKRGTFLYVTHSTNDVISLCQKAIWLEHGQVQMIGPAKAVAEEYLSSQAMERSQRLSIVRQAREKNAAPAQEPARAPQPVQAANVRVLAQPEIAHIQDAHPHRPPRDQRKDFINGSNLRNDIEVPDFEMDDGIGVGGAKILTVKLLDQAGAPLSWVVGGEPVRLYIEARAERDLENPLMGFQVRDRLGQSLFADNTYLVTLGQPLAVSSDRLVRAQFDFQMPLLPKGEYAVRVAIQDGTQDEAEMLHCITSALVFRSQTAGPRHGIIGIPMERIAIDVQEAGDAPKAAAKQKHQ